MRRTGYLSTYNRAIVARKRPEPGEAGAPEIELSKSLLAGFAGQEAHLIVDFVKWAEADRTTYEGN